jgi:hypothetical protein
MINRMWSVILLAALGLAPVASCGGRTTACAEHDTRTCACPGDAVGKQTCEPGGGSFLACDCSAATCADARDMCGASCCGIDSVCVANLDQAVCGLRCNIGSECPGDKGCCAYSQTGEGGCIVPGSIKARACLCATAAECSTGVCGQFSDQQGTPSGIHFCAPNDGFEYDGCNDGVACRPDSCCIHVAGNGSNLCEIPCTDSSQCGAAKCVSLGGGNCLGSSGVCQ